VKRHRLTFALCLGLLLPNFQLPTATAIDYIRLSGVVQSNSVDRSGSTYVRLWLQGQFGGQILADAEVQANGSYSMLVPKNTPVEIALLVFNGGSAGWKKSTIFSQDTILNLTIPLGIKISGRIVDAQGAPLGNAFVRMDEFNDPMDAFQISSDGTSWTGYVQRQSVKADSTGNFVLYSYATREIGFKRTLIVESSGNPGFTWSSPKFIIDGPAQFVVCIPIGFGASLSLPSYCSQDQIAKAAADSRAVADAKAIADAKAAADKVAADAKAIADAKAAADKVAADKVAADKVVAEAKAIADKAAAEANRREQIISASPLISGPIPLSASGLPIKVSSTSNLSVFAYTNTNNVCEFANGLIKTKTSGRCVIAFSQAGNSEFKSATNFILDFNIVSAAKKTTITCVKGKLTKKVIAIEPVCPAGYKKK